jgi:imidazolonepropionase-like amidohydrolase
LLIINAQIHTMEGSPISDGYIKTNGSVIEALGEMASAPGAQDANTVDARGGVLLPGLIDAHTHIGMWEDSLGFEGDDGNEQTDPATPQLSAEDAVNPLDRCFTEALDAGVTTVVTGPGSANPVGGRMIAMKTCGRRVDDMIIKNPAAVKFALGENPKTVYHTRDEAPVTRMGTAAVIREQLFKAQKYMEKLAKAAEDEDADEPDFDYKCEALIPLLRGEVQAHFHAHRADDIFTAVRIAKEFSLDYVLIHCTEGHLIADELAREGAKVLSGPFLCDRSKPELHNLTPASPGIMNAAGLEPAIITDHPVIPLQYLMLCAALAVREGMDRDAALRAVTINPAKILKLDGRIGSLRPGKDADMVLYSGDPLALKTRTRLVLCGGKRAK